MPGRPAVARLPRHVPVGPMRRTLEAVRIVRANFVFGALLLLLALLLGRFAQLQLVNGAAYRAQADARRAGAVTVSGVRGRIVDVNGQLLATSSFGREVAVDPDPRVLTEAQIDDLALRLSVILDDDDPPQVLRERLLRARAEQHEQDGPFGLRWVRTGSRHVVLRGYVDEPRVVAALDAASAGPERLRGLKVRSVERRSYPNGSYAAHVLGLPPVQGGGGEGLEQLLDVHLEAQQARAEVTRDGRARWLASTALFDRDLLAGREVRVSLDIVIQHHLEVALDALCREWSPSYTVGVVLDPRTGAVLALANRPTFDPNPDARPDQLPGNLAVCHLFEPGSVIKPFTVAWALESGFPPDSIVPMPQSRMFPGDRAPITDSHEVGDGDLVRLLGESSNTGAAHLSDWLGAQRMLGLMAWLGLSKPTGIELPYERAWKRAWDVTGRPLARSDQLRMAFGYAIGVTPVRLAAAYTAFARDDARPVMPTLRPQSGVEPRLGEPLCSPAHLAHVRQGLAACVDTGTARKAFAEATYRAAGKTGTAIIDARQRHVCSFAGYAPREAPRLLVLVMAVTQRSRDGSGGKVAAPAACHVLERSLPYLGVAPDRAAPAASTVPPNAVSGVSLPAIAPTEEPAPQAPGEDER